MATKATPGKGLVFAINTGTASTPTWTLVGETFKLDLKPKMGTEEATSFDSAALEYIATIADGGELPFSCNRVSTDTGQAAVMAAGPLGASAGALKQFQVTAPKAVGQTTTGDVWGCSAIVTEFNPAFEPAKKTVMTGVLRISGLPTYTEGS